MRQYGPGAEIRVRADAEGRPLAFAWRGEPHRVESVEEVREPRLDWWAAGGEVHRVYYLVVTHRGLVCEIYRDVGTGAWRIGRRYD